MPQEVCVQKQKTQVKGGNIGANVTWFRGLKVHPGWECGGSHFIGTADSHTVVWVALESTNRHLVWWHHHRAFWKGHLPSRGLRHLWHLHFTGTGSIHSIHNRTIWKFSVTHTPSSPSCSCVRVCVCVERNINWGREGLRAERGVEGEEGKNAANTSGLTNTKTKTKKHSDWTGHSVRRGRKTFPGADLSHLLTVPLSCFYDSAVGRSELWGANKPMQRTTRQQQGDWISNHRA